MSYHTRRTQLALLFALACADPATPPPPTVASADRVLAAADSLNAAMKALYRDGGRVIYLAPLFYDFDPTIAPELLVTVRRP